MYCFVLKLILRIMEENAKKRIRSSNFTAEEKEILFGIIKQHKNIIENKKTDGVTIEEKNKSWREITAKFNTQAPSYNQRTEESLRKFYKNQKKILRQKVANDNKNHFATGGGPHLKTICSEDDLLLSIINTKTVFGLSNPFDSDGIRENLKSNNGNLNQNREINNPTSQEKASGSEAVQADEQDTSSLNNIEFIFMDESNEPSTENNTEIINVNEEVVKTRTPDKNNWKKFKSDDLTKQMAPPLQNKIRTTPLSRQLNHSRRRPTSCITRMTSSVLGEKYEKLVDKQMELVEGLKKENALRILSLELEIKIKNKTLESLSKYSED